MSVFKQEEILKTQHTRQYNMFKKKKKAIQFNTEKAISAHTVAVHYMGNKKLLAILFTTKFMEPNLFRMPYICVDTAQCVSNN